MTVLINFEADDAFALKGCRVADETHSLSLPVDRCNQTFDGSVVVGEADGCLV